jgi:hypothetical protein
MIKIAKQKKEVEVKAVGFIKASKSDAKIMNWRNQDGV